MDEDSTDLDVLRDEAVRGWDGWRGVGGSARAWFGVNESGICVQARWRALYESECTASADLREELRRIKVELELLRGAPRGAAYAAASGGAPFASEEAESPSAGGGAERAAVAGEESAAAEGSRRASTAVGGEASPSGGEAVGGLRVEVSSQVLQSVIPPTPTPRTAKVLPMDRSELPATIRAPSGSRVPMFDSFAVVGPSFWDAYTALLSESDRASLHPGRRAPAASAPEKGGGRERERGSSSPATTPSPSAGGGGGVGAAAAAAAARSRFDLPEPAGGRLGLAAEVGAGVLYAFPSLPGDLAEVLPSFCFVGPVGVTSMALGAGPSASALRAVVSAQASAVSERGRRWMVTMLPGSSSENEETEWEDGFFAAEQGEEELRSWLERSQRRSLMWDPATGTHVQVVPARGRMLLCIRFDEVFLPGDLLPLPDPPEEAHGAPPSPTLSAEDAVVERDVRRARRRARAAWRAALPAESAADVEAELLRPLTALRHAARTTGALGLRYALPGMAQIVRDTETCVLVPRVACFVTRMPFVDLHGHVLSELVRRASVAIEARALHTLANVRRRRDHFDALLRAATLRLAAPSSKALVERLTRQGAPSTASIGATDPAGGAKRSSMLQRLWNNVTRKESNSTNTAANAPGTSLTTGTSPTTTNTTTNTANTTSTTGTSSTLTSAPRRRKARSKRRIHAGAAAPQRAGDFHAGPHSAAPSGHDSHRSGAHHEDVLVGFKGEVIPVSGHGSDEEDGEEEEDDDYDEEDEDSNVSSEEEADARVRADSADGESRDGHGAGRRGGHFLPAFLSESVLLLLRRYHESRPPPYGGELRISLSATDGATGDSRGHDEDAAARAEGKKPDLPVHFVRWHPVWGLGMGTGGAERDGGALGQWHPVWGLGLEDGAGIAAGIPGLAGLAALNTLSDAEGAGGAGGGGLGGGGLGGGSGSSGNDAAPSSSSSSSSTSGLTAAMLGMGAATARTIRRAAPVAHEPLHSFVVGSYPIGRMWWMPLTGVMLPPETSPQEGVSAQPLLGAGAVEDSDDPEAARVFLAGADELLSCVPSELQDHVWTLLRRAVPEGNAPLPPLLWPFASLPIVHMVLPASSPWNPEQDEENEVTLDEEADGRERARRLRLDSGGSGGPRSADEVSAGREITMRLLHGRARRFAAAGAGWTDPELDAALADWCLPVLFSLVPMDVVILLLGAILTERNVAIVGAKMDDEALTASVLGLLLLMRPLAWVFSVFPVVPEDMLAVLESPLPFVVGLRHAVTRERVAGLEHAMLFDLFSAELSLPGGVSGDANETFLHIQLPGRSELCFRTEEASRHLYTTGPPMSNGRFGPLYAPSPLQVRAARSIAEAVRAHLVRHILGPLFGPFLEHAWRKAGCASPEDVARLAARVACESAPLPPLPHPDTAWEYLRPRVADGEMPFWDNLSGTQLLRQFVVHYQLTRSLADWRRKRLAARGLSLAEPTRWLSAGEEDDEYDDDEDDRDGDGGGDGRSGGDGEGGKRGEGGAEEDKTPRRFTADDDALALLDMVRRAASRDWTFLPSSSADGVDDGLPAQPQTAGTATGAASASASGTGAASLSGATAAATATATATATTPGLVHRTRSDSLTGGTHGKQTILPSLMLGSVAIPQTADSTRRGDMDAIRAAIAQGAEADRALPHGISRHGTLGNLPTTPAVERDSDDEDEAHLARARAQHHQHEHERAEAVEVVGRG